MSLISLVFRNLTALALTDRTLAGAEVRSSLLVPINELQETEPKPMIAVFTDHSKAEDAQIDGNDLLGAMATLTLALEIACITKVPTEDQQGSETFIPETDEGMEMTLDVIQRQSLVELQSGQSIWASLWRDCRIKVKGIVVERGASIEKGVRFAARRVEIHTQVLREPVPGKPLTKFWVDVLAAFDADPRMSGLAVMLRKLVVGGTLPEWRQWQAELGLTDSAIRAIGVAPFEGAEDPVTGQPSVSTDSTIEDRSGQTDAMRLRGGSVTIQRGNGLAVELVEADV